jgi:hypothetical protein
MTLVLTVAIMVGLLPPSPGWAKKKRHPPGALIAASVGDEVIIVEPSTGRTKAISTGPVAWLFPAPGGVLYAPDLVGGRTTVIDLVTQVTRETIDGVTMPHFGEMADRYVAISRQILVMSYPERALIRSIDFTLRNPWQVEIVAGDRILLVLERRPDGIGEQSLVAVKLDEGKPVYRRLLAGDFRRFALSEEAGVLILADAARRQVVLMDPATATPFESYPVEGRPMDLVFLADGDSLLTAVARGTEAGELLLWKFTAQKKGGMERKEQWSYPLSGVPERLALSPDGRYVAVAFASGGLAIIDVDRQEEVVVAELGGAPRDFRWCDPSVAGPLLPDWSDQKPPELDLGDPKRDFYKRPTPTR